MNHPRGATPAGTPLAADADSYRAVRDTSAALIAPLSAEDCQAQSMPDASPAKWHLAHTSWFFETFVLERAEARFQPFDAGFRVLFNSYYNQVGAQHPRPQRGLLTRPDLERVLAYRAQVDARMLDLLTRPGPADPQLLALVELGLHHEQQHQELLLMDVKHLFSCNPLLPAYRADAGRQAGGAPALRWLEYDGGLHACGADGGVFAFDNERPRHEVRLAPYALASRLVTNGEFQAFIADGGYRRPELWLADGWAAVQAGGWHQPYYWRTGDGEAREFTLRGTVALDPATPVSHVSYYEADAYASWCNARLPAEAEWEHAAAQCRPSGNLLESGALHPAPAPAARGLTQVFGDLWEWTRSAYGPYPGYRPPAGAVGEYNGKFMCSQLVLRGGACITPRTHIRASYRNFFYPHTHWQFSGIRLARDGR